MKAFDAFRPAVAALFFSRIANPPGDFLKKQRPAASFRWPQTAGKRKPLFSDAFFGRVCYKNEKD
jgi:hypothetical protein